MSWWPFGKKSSKDTLKDRLQMVLVYDRMSLAPGKAEALKRDVLEVLKRYFPEAQDLDIQLETIEDKMMLRADLPLKQELNSDAK